MSPPEGDERKDLTDAELLAWARKRGVVSFLFFFTIATAIAVWWYLTR